MPSNQAIEQVTNASYQRALMNDTPALTGGVEAELAVLAGNITADDSKDTLFPWIREKIYVSCASQPTLLFWYVIKCLGTDAVQQVLDDAVLEQLQRDSKIFARGAVKIPYFAVTGGYASFDYEFHNVKLKDGEELRVVIHAVDSVTIGAFGDLEWRETGV